MMKKLQKLAGFTLVELVVTLVILGIVAGISVPAYQVWRKNSALRESEAYAKTLYLASQAAFSGADSTGTLDRLLADVKKNGTMVDNANAGITENNGTAIPENRIYGITLDADSSLDNDTQKELRALIAPYLYDTSLLRCGMSIEVDVAARTVYAAFASTWLPTLRYQPGDPADVFERTIESRSNRVIGYYSVHDLGHVVQGNALRLKVMNLKLVNEETLHLDFSGNSTDIGLQYTISLYEEGGTSPLFTMALPLNGTHYSDGNPTRLSVTVPNPDDPANPAQKEYWFPVEIDSEGNISLTLDAMMSAQMQENLKDSPAADISDKDSSGLTAKDGFSMARFGALGDKKVYATVQLAPGGGGLLPGDGGYLPSSVGTSNSEDPYFAESAVDGTGSETISVTYYRHLYNIRWKEELARQKDLGAEDASPARRYQQTADMEFDSANLAVYDIKTVGVANTFIKRTGDQPDTVFPTVEVLQAKAVYDGGNRRMHSLRLGESSVAQDISVNGALHDGAVAPYGTFDNADARRYLGLFGINRGTVQNLILSAASLTYGNPAAADDSADAWKNSQNWWQTTGENGGAVKIRPIFGAGLVCGLSTGILQNISTLGGMSELEANRTTVSAVVAYGGIKQGEAVTVYPGGVGGVAGAVVPQATSAAVFTGLSTRGSVVGRVDTLLTKAADPANTRIDEAIQAPAAAQNDQLAQVRSMNPHSGVGGIIGHARDVSFAVEGLIIQSRLQNAADVTGNLLTGGFVGSFISSSDSLVSITGATNTGLILCSDKYAAETAAGGENSMTGYHVGGIVGAAIRASIQNGVSTPGANNPSQATRRYEGADRENKLLRGKYVGGIVGFAFDDLIDGAKTGQGGYVLGQEEVGGIVGSVQVSEDNQDNPAYGITAENDAYVIGQINVGGIVGSNRQMLLRNCTNAGVAAATKYNAGGIAGYNNGDIYGCTTQIYGYGNTTYNMVVGWEATGNNAGGIVGFNDDEGSILNPLKEDGTQDLDATLDIAPLTVGGSNVGGIVGYNRGVLGAVYRFTAGGSIIGLRDKRATESYLTENGLSGEAFYVTAPAGSVENGMENAAFEQYGLGNCVGGIVGYNVASQLYNNTFTVVNIASVSGQNYVGGIVGASITSSTNTGAVKINAATSNSMGTVTGSSYVGGIAGYLSHSVVDENGKKTAAGQMILGEGEDSGNPSARGELGRMNVAAWRFAGGLVGYAEPGTNLTVRNVKCPAAVSGTSATASPGPVSETQLAELLGMDKANLTEPQKADLARLTEDGGVYAVGGVVGYASKQSAIKNCENTASVTGQNGLGGVVGLNAGTMENCSRSASLGGGTTNLVGGIAGVNAGTVNGITVATGATILAKNTTGGAVGANLSAAMLTNPVVNAAVSAQGDDVGGLVGWNNGTISLTIANAGVFGNVSGKNRVGGLVGYSVDAAKISVMQDAVVGAFTGTTLRVSGTQSVGGLFGHYGGTVENIGSDNTVYRLINYATVLASAGNAGGIAGEAAVGSKLHDADNYGTVMADPAGNAAGVVAENNGIINGCVNYASITAQNGWVGGIVAKNNTGGTVQNCRVDTEKTEIQLWSNQDYMGGVAAVNNGTLENCTLNLAGNGLILRGSAKSRGGIVGTNGTQADYADAALSACAIEGDNAKLQLLQEGVSVTNLGSIAGQNWGVMNGTVSGKNTVITLNHTLSSSTTAKNVGGIAGINGGILRNYTYQGKIEQEGVARADDSVGGIVGRNEAAPTPGAASVVQDCSLQDSSIVVYEGTYTAATTELHSVKDSSSTHVGGIAGRNAAGAAIEGCLLLGKNNLQIARGGALAGGVTGYNQGSISRSGSAIITGSEFTDAEAQIQTDATTALNTLDLLSDAILADNADRYAYAKEKYYTEKGIADDSQTTLSMASASGGSASCLGGIVGLNGPAGTVKNSASGCWTITNKSTNTDATVGGIIAMNEAEETLENLVNFAAVVRSSSNVAGGVIGRQENRTTTDYIIRNCLNFGGVNVSGDRAGGVIGAVKYRGGTIQGCRNYGKLTKSSTSSAGILAATVYLDSDQTLNIIDCLNDVPGYSAGIFARVQNLRNTKFTETINIIGCVNTSAGIPVSSDNNAGIFADSSSEASQNTTVNLIRCRNYAKILGGGQGISGKNATGKVVLTECFDISESANSLTDTAETGSNSNYYVDDAVNANPKQNSFFSSASPISMPRITANNSFPKITYSNIDYNSKTESDDKTPGFQKNHGMDKVYDGNDDSYMAFNVPSGYTELSFTMDFTLPFTLNKITTKRWDNGQGRSYLYQVHLYFIDGDGHETEVTEDYKLSAGSGSDASVTKSDIYPSGHANSGWKYITIKDSTSGNFAIPVEDTFTPEEGAREVNRVVYTYKQDTTSGVLNPSKPLLIRGIQVWNNDNDELVWSGRGSDDSKKGTRLYLQNPGATAQNEQTFNDTGDTPQLVLEAKDGKTTRPGDSYNESTLFAATSTTLSPAGWWNWENMIAGWYSRRSGEISAPLNLSVIPGQTYTVQWEKPTTGEVLYYQTELYVYENEAAAKADPDFVNPLDSATRTTYGGLQTVFTLRENWPGKWFVVRTKAVGYAGQVSPYATLEQMPFVTALATPVVRGELRKNGSTYQYEYRVVNEAKYQSNLQDMVDTITAEKGIIDETLCDANSYWAVALSQNSTKVTLTAGTRQIMTVPGQIASLTATADLRTDAQMPAGVNAANWKLVRDALRAQFGASATNTQMTKPYSPTELTDKYGLSSVSCSFSGQTVADLVITAKVKRAAGDDTNAPYAVELVYASPETANGDTTYTYTVVASQDVLIGSDLTVSAVFEGINSSYLPTAGSDKKLYVRARLAQTSLGPVYYYYPVEESAPANLVFAPGVGPADAGDRCNTELADSANPTQATSNFTGLVLSAECGNLSVIPEPTGLSLTADTTGNTLEYTLQWNRVTGSYGALVENYQVSVYGVNYAGQENETVIELLKDVVVAPGTEPTASVKTGQGGIASADAWDYETLRIEVSRVGGLVVQTQYVGLTAQQDFVAQKRLSAPGQPSLSVYDRNEMIYTVSFNASNDDLPLPEGEDASVSVCADYILHAAIPNGQGTPAEVVLATIPAEAAARYETRVELRNYQGKEVAFWVTARHNPAMSDWMDSAPGVSTSLTLPVPIEDPVCSNEAPQWDADAAYSAEEFGTVVPWLNLDLKNQSNAAYPAGTTFVAYANIYADGELQKNDSGELELLNGKIQVNRDSDSGEQFVPQTVPTEGVQTLSLVGGAEYTYTVTYQGVLSKYAGGWLVPYFRATNGTDMSSRWVQGTPQRLPNVKLDAPSVERSKADREVTVHWSAPDGSYENADEAGGRFLTANWTLADKTLDSANALVNGYLVRLAWLNGSGIESLRAVRTQDPTGENPDTWSFFTGVTAMDSEGGETTVWTELGSTGAPESDNFVTENEEGGYTVTFGEPQVLEGTGYSPQEGLSNQIYRCTLRAQLTVRLDDDGNTLLQLCLPDSDGELFGANETHRRTDYVEVTALATKDGTDSGSTIKNSDAAKCLINGEEEYALVFLSKDAAFRVAQERPATPESATPESATLENATSESATPESATPESATTRKAEPVVSRPPTNTPATADTAQKEDDV